MQFKCPECSGIVRIDPANLGKTVSCGHCRKIVNAPQSRFASGVIINDFMIEREAGFGGMGVVYLARQITLDRPVALKILKEKYAQDTEFIVQFVKEARAAAKLNHPNIVQAYAVGEEDGIFFFAMEFIDGKTMKEELAEKKKIDQLTAAKIIRDIAGALDYAWTESKIVHHDIKPDNIMLNKTGKAKLADLGLAAVSDESMLDSDGDEVLGTPQYISPEQLLGEQTDVRSDIYSLGATFYHFVTGNFPYTGENTTEIAHQHVKGTLIPPVEKEKTLDPRLNDIIVKMMAKDIKQRYQSAAELVDDLQNYIDICTGRTASVPIATIPQPSTITGKFPSGGLKLSLRGSAKSPSTPASQNVAAQTVTMNPPSSLMEKKATPSSNQTATAKAQTSLNVPKVSTGVSVPKVSVHAVVPPVVKKVEAPAVTVPKLGLKNAEPAPAPVPAAEEKKEPPKAEPAEKQKADFAEKSAKNKDKKSKKSKKSSAPRKFPKVLAVLLVLLLAAGGGVAYYMYRNNWKAPVWDKLVAWNNARREAAKRIVHRVPPPQKKEPAIEEIRKDYVPEAEELIKFIADNPSRGKDFMKKVDGFMAKWGAPRLDNEKKPYNDLLALYNEMDEKFWAAPGRNPLRIAHQNEINRRIKIEKDRLAEEKRIQDARRAEEARRVAFERAEAEKRRREAEEKRQNDRKLREYQQKIAPLYPQLTKLFYESIFSEAKEAEFVRIIDNLFTDYNPDGVQMQLHKNLDDYVRALKAEIAGSRRMYLFMTENTRRFTGHITVFPRLGQVEIISVDFPGRKIVVRSIISEKNTTLSLDDSNVYKKIFDLWAKKLSKVPDIKYLQFYYELFFGDKSKAAQKAQPSAIWKVFFRNYR